MKHAAIIIFALMTACSHPSASPPVNSAPAQTSPKPSALNRPANIFPLPKIQTFGQQTLERYSYAKTIDKNTGFMRSLPPWKWATLSPDFEKYPSPDTGYDNKLTVVPLGVEIAPIELRIVKVCARDYPLEQKVYHYSWEAVLEPITQAEFLEYKPDEELPFAVLWIYPSVEFALPLSSDKLTAEMLPEGVERDMVATAIDLTNDQQPDLLMARYCVDPPIAESLETAPCQRVYFRKYVKDKEGKWKQLEDFWPCPRTQRTKPRNSFKWARNQRAAHHSGR